MGFKKSVSALLALTVFSSFGSIGLCDGNEEQEQINEELSAYSQYDGSVTKPNILFITADDLNFDSLGFTGSPVDNISPNLDRLASEGMFFKNAHVSVAVCQPSRETLMTGLYPHNSGAVGFVPIKSDVTNLQQYLQDEGYINGIIGKITHLQPKEKFPWDFEGDSKQNVIYDEEYDDNGKGKGPKVYYNEIKKFFKMVKEENKPFFFMANSHDPHRPYAGSLQELNTYKENTKVSRQYNPDEVNVPGFLPELDQIKLEMSEYYSSVHRLDETVGLVLQALEEEGFKDNTIVMFLSDNGISMPFAKSNVYLTSTHTPWLVRWPDKIAAGTVDETNFISGIDFTPTILEAVGKKDIEGFDGKSFLPLLLGEQQEGRNEVYTFYGATSAFETYTMRSVQSKQFGYIFNPWAYENKTYKAEALAGRTFKAMEDKVKSDEQIAQRVETLKYRTVEEFYDIENDPYALNNLINSPEYTDQINIFRSMLLENMEKSNDPIAPALKEYIDTGKIENSALDIEVQKEKKNKKAKKANKGKKANNIEEEVEEE